MAGSTITINRAPVLTLWAAIVAERLGHDREAALTLGKALAGMNAASKGRRLGIYGPEAGERPARPAAKPDVEPLMGREIPVTRGRAGVRALDKGTPIAPESVQRYLEGKFGDALPDAEKALRALARSRTPAALAAEAFALYERFRPGVPEGVRGWGAAGVLDLSVVARLAKAKA